MQLTSVIVLATLAAGIVATPPRAGGVSTGQLRRIEKAELRKGERMGERKEAHRLARRPAPRSLDIVDSNLEMRSPILTPSFVKKEERKMLLKGERMGERKEAKKIGGARVGGARGARLGGARRQRSLDDEFELEVRGQRTGHGHGKHGHKHGKHGKKHGHKHAQSAPSSPAAESAPASPAPESAPASAPAAARSFEDDFELEVRGQGAGHRHGKHGHKHGKHGKKHGHKHAQSAPSSPAAESAPASPAPESAPAAARSFEDDFELEVRGQRGQRAGHKHGKHGHKHGKKHGHKHAAAGSESAPASPAPASPAPESAPAAARSFDDFDFELEARTPTRPISGSSLKKEERKMFLKGERMGERKEKKIGGGRVGAARVGGGRVGGSRVGGARRERSLDDDFELEVRGQGAGHRHGKKHGHKHGKKHGHKHAQSGAAGPASESAPASPAPETAPAAARSLEELD